MQTACNKVAHFFQTENSFNENFGGQEANWLGGARAQRRAYAAAPCSGLEARQDEHDNTYYDLICLVAEL